MKPLLVLISDVLRNQFQAVTTLFSMRCGTFPSSHAHKWPNGRKDIERYIIIFCIHKSKPCHGRGTSVQIVAEKSSTVLFD